MELPRIHRIFFIGFSLILLTYPEMIAPAVLHKPEAKQIQIVCGKHEVFSRCEANPLCEKSCDNIDIWESAPCIQRKSCLSGCICKEGYVRDNDQGACIWENSCPRVRH